MLRRLDLRTAPLPAHRPPARAAAARRGRRRRRARPGPPDRRRRARAWGRGGAGALRAVRPGAPERRPRARRRRSSGALAALDPAVRAALETSIERARIVHADQRRFDVTTQVVPGGTVTERWVPVRRVGLYVPGGLAVYPSSVVMNVVPAQVAGVGVARAGLAAAGRARRPAAPDGPGRLRAARRRRGVRGRRRAGDRAARVRRTDTDGAGWSRSTWSPGRATSTSPPPSGCCAG